MHPQLSRRISENQLLGVDFPRITEICQRVADRPDEVSIGLQEWISHDTRKPTISQWLAISWMMNQIFTWENGWKCTISIH